MTAARGVASGVAVSASAERRKVTSKQQRSNKVEAAQFDAAKVACNENKASTGA
jgi:hypothetical protein